MQYILLLSIFYKAFHLGYKEIPDINIIRNKREYTHNCCLEGNTRGNGIYPGNQDYKIPSLFRGSNGDTYFFLFYVSDSAEL